MVRTRAESSVRKAVAAKAPRKQVGSSSSCSKTPSKKGGYSAGGGGNALRMCDIPAWQKGISEFYPKLKTNEKIGTDVDGSYQSIAGQSSDATEFASMEVNQQGSSKPHQQSTVSSSNQISNIDGDDQSNGIDYDEESEENIKAGQKIEDGLGKVTDNDERSDLSVESCSA